MGSKGFTLIELLAVIVILAIIALIATPIVLGIIDESRQSSNRLSAGYIVDTVEKAYSMAYTKKQGVIPKKDDVRAEFSMSNAVWNVAAGEETNDTIVTTNGEVKCIVHEDGSSLSVSCEGYSDIMSATMEIEAN